jgi:uncharacterized protein (TIGR02246 family)
MRFLASSLLLVAALAAELPAQGHPGAEQAVRAAVERFARGFRDASDPAAVAALFQPDADVRNLAQGWTRKGTAELERLWASGFERHRDFPRDVRVQTIRILAPGIALVDGSLERGAGQDPGGGAVPPWREYFSMVLMEQDGQWYIVAARAGGWNPVDPRGSGSGP